MRGHFHLMELPAIQYPSMYRIFPNKPDNSKKLRGSVYEHSSQVQAFQPVSAKQISLPSRQAYMLQMNQPLMFRDNCHLSEHAINQLKY